jgi:AAA domain
VYERAGEDDTPVVEGFLYECFMTDLVGGAGAGKTTLLIAMVKAILTGGRFLGHRCQKGSVIYLTEQAENIRNTMEKVGLDPEHEGLYLLPHKNVHDMTWEKAYTAARSMANHVGARTIITDTIDDFGGLDSDKNNNDGDVRRVLRPPKAAAQVDGLAVLNVRQMNKEGRGKGSVEYEYAHDILMALFTTSGNHPDNVREVRVNKSRTREELPLKRLVEFRDTRYYDLGSETKIQSRRVKEVVRPILTQHGKMRKTKLKEMIKDELDRDGIQVSDATIGRVLDSMKDKEIRVDEVKGKGNPQVCSLISSSTLLSPPKCVPDEDVL